MTNVLLATSNGTGMGHLTRQAAIGLALAREHQPTLFSLSIGLPLATGLGIDGEYCPSYDRPWLPPRAWNGYLRDRLVAIVEETSAEVVLFDGVAPYPGIGLATMELRAVAFIWLRRGMWRPGVGGKHLRRSRFFDVVIEPGDLAADADRGPTVGQRKVERVAPISLVEVLPPLSRDQARTQLGLPLDREVALVTLGSGRLGDVAGPGQTAITTLLEHRDLHVAVTRSAVARNEIPVGYGDRVTEIRDVYPLVPYLECFDLAVSSAGYNAVHELVPSGLPALFVANTATRTDDQEARARHLAGLGLALHANDTDPAAVASGVRALLDRGRRSEVAAAARETRASLHGASDTAALATSLAASFTRRAQKPSILIGNGIQQAKERIKETLGEERTEKLKRLLGRHPTPMGEQTTVTLVDHPQPPPENGPVPLAVTESLSRNDLLVAGPVEHLLPGSSEAYRRRRLDLIEHYYHLAP